MEVSDQLHAPVEGILKLQKTCLPISCPFMCKEQKYGHKVREM